MGGLSSVRTQASYLRARLPYADVAGYEIHHLNSLKLQSIVALLT